jgi:hypothetical protein
MLTDIELKEKSSTKENLFVVHIPPMIVYPTNELLPSGLRFGSGFHKSFLFLMKIIFV